MDAETKTSVKTNATDELIKASQLSTHDAMNDVAITATSDATSAATREADRIATKSSTDN